MDVGWIGTSISVAVGFLKPYFPKGAIKVSCWKNFDRFVWIWGFGWVVGNVLHKN